MPKTNQPTANVLVVEDERITARDLQRTLQRAGYRVPAVAFSGEEAVIKTREHDPDLILMDIVMPGEMDGIQAAQEIHQQRDVPIVYLTAYGDAEIVERAKTTEPIAYVLKPYDERNLLTTIELALHQYISARNRSEAEIRASEEKYRSLVDNALTGVYQTALDGTILFANPELARMLNFDSPADLIGTKVSERYKNPQDRARMLEIVKQEEQVRNFEVELLTREGQTRTVLLSARLEDGTLSGMIRDITARKQAEAQNRFLANLVESVSDAIIAMDMSQNIISWNTAAEAMYGWKEAEVLGRSAKEILDTDFLKNSREAVTKQILEQGSWSGEVLQLRRDGTRIPAWSSTSLYRDSQGKPHGIVAVNHDIRERKRAEKVQETIYKVSQAAVTTDSMDELYRSVHNILGEILQVDNFFIALYDRANDLLSFPYFVDQYDEPTPPRRPGRGLTEYVLRTGRPLLTTPDIFDQLIQRGEVELVGTNSFDWLGVPLKVSEQIIGVMVTQSYTEEVRLSQKELELMEFVSTQVATAIERKRAQEAVHQSEARYRSLAENFPNGAVFLYDHDLRYLVADGASLQAAGYSPERMIGRTLPEVLASSPNLNRLIKLYQAALAGKTTSLETYSGDRNYENISAPVKDEKGVILAGMVISQDITERKRAEQNLQESEKKYRSVVTAMAEGVVLQEASGFIVAANTAAELALGLTIDQMMGRTSMDPSWRAIHEDGSPFPGETHPAMITLKTGRPLQNVIMGVHKPDGSLTWISINSEPLISSGEKLPHAVVTTFHDITERKRAEEQIKRNAARAEALARNAARLNAHLNLDAVLKTVCEEASRALNVPAAFVNLYNSEHDTLDFAANLGLPPEFVKSYHSPSRALYDEYSRRLGPMVIIPDVQALTDIPNTEAYALLNVRSVANARMQRDHQLIGVLSVLTIDQPREFSDDERALFQGLADQAAQAIINAKLVQDVQRQFVERKKAEETVRAILNATTDSLFMLDTAYTVLALNETTAQRLNRKSEEILGHTISDFLPPSLAQKRKAQIDEVVHSGKSVRFEDERAGMTFENSIYPVLGFDGKVASVAVLARDITERRRAEEIIADQATQYTTMLSVVDQGFWLVSDKGKLMDVNNAYCKMSGYTREELLTLSVPQLEASEAPEETARHIQGVIEKGTDSFESTHRAKDGTIFDVEVTAAFWKEKGLFFVFVKDITERKQAGQEKQKLIALIESSADLIGISALDGHVLYLNRAGQELVGLGSSEVQSKVIFDFLTPEDTLALQEQIIPAVMQNGRWNGETRFRHFKTGQSIPVELNGFIIQDPETHQPIAMATVSRDITERKEMERRIADALKFNQTIISSSPFGITVYLASGECILANETIARIVGGTREQILQQNFRHIASWQKSGLLQAAEEALASGTERRHEFHMLTTFGKEAWLDCRLVPFSSGGEQHLLVLFDDISKRRQAEQSLRESEERFSKIVHLSNTAIAIATLEGPIIEANPRLSSLTGFSRDEIIGHSSFELGLISPETRERLIQQLRKDGSINDMELELRRKDGNPLITLLSMHMIDLGGKRHALTMFHDITDRKRAEESLALQARIANIALTVSDEEMYNEVLKGILETMQSPFGVFGYIDEDGALVVPTMTRQVWDQCKVTGKPIRFPRETWGDSSWPRALREKKTNYSNEVSNRTPEGHVLIQRHISTPILFQGEVVGLFQVANREADYTEADIHLLETIAGHVAYLLNARLLRDRAQEALRKLNAELEQRVAERTSQLLAANKELESFSYSVSHDLRAPLRSIDGFSRILLEDYAGKLDKDGQGALERVRAGAQRMARLIDDLLKLSRITRVEIIREQVNLSEIANAIRVELETVQPERRVEWVIAEGVAAECDPTLVRAVLENLLGNAWKFTGKREKARIEFGVMAEGIEHRAKSEEPSALRPTPSAVYFVRDNGAGFDMAYADKLFGAFQRLHSEEEFPGTGIGLATVQRIIHRHGGRIWVEGEVDKGATFYFTLKGEP